MDSHLSFNEKINVAVRNPPVGESQIPLSVVMEIIDDAVWVLDDNMRLLAQNKTAGEILVWPLSEAIGASLYELLPSNNSDPHVLCKLIEQTTKQQKPETFTEVIVTTREDYSVLVSGKIMPLLIGGSQGSICTFRKVYPDRSKQYLQFEFADMVSHLLRTPLSLIQTSIDLLMNVELDSVKQQATLDQVRAQNQRLSIFTNELLKMLRLDTEGMYVSFEPVEIVPLIQQVLNMVQEEKTSHTFIFEPEDTFPVATADLVKMELVLINLLFSAVRRCPAGGSITVKVEVDQSEVIISVIDNGKPIPDSLLEKIFRQFYPVNDGGNNRIPSTYHLGLYTTKRLVEMQNGRIWAKTEPGQYTQFSFALPVWEDA